MGNEQWVMSHYPAKQGARPLSIRPIAHHPSPITIFPEEKCY